MLVASRRRLWFSSRKEARGLKYVRRECRKWAARLLEAAYYTAAAADQGARA